MYQITFLFQFSFSLPQIQTGSTDKYMFKQPICKLCNGNMSKTTTPFLFYFYSATKTTVHKHLQLTFSCLGYSTNKPINKINNIENTET